MKRVYFFVLLYGYSLSVDNPHFYKASQFFYKPRLEEDCLTSFQAIFGGGKSETSYNSDKEVTYLLNLYGAQNFHLSAKGVSQKILDKDPTGYLNTFYEDSVGPRFGQVIFDGHFKIAQIYFDFEKNFYNGFFYQLNLPVRKLVLSDFKIIDLSEKSDAGDASWTGWNNFISNLKENLRPYGIEYPDETDSTGVGDFAIMVGKTWNYEDTTKLDFLDATVKLGVLFPTGKTTDPDLLFDLPTGYNGYWCTPIFSSFAVGIFEWLTLGSYFNGYIFYPKQKTLRVKTDEKQNGFVKLQKIRAHTKHGNIFTGGFYIEADHISKGYSFMLSYQYNKEFPTTIIPKNSKSNPYINQKVIESDPMLQGYTIHNINFYVEYDFAEFEHPNAPKIQISLDIPFHGIRTFNTKIGNFSWMIDYGQKF